MVPVLDEETQRQVALDYLKRHPIRVAATVVEPDDIHPCCSTRDLLRAWLEFSGETQRVQVRIEADTERKVPVQDLTLRVRVEL